jgi:hypothetical protein
VVGGGATEKKVQREHISELSWVFLRNFEIDAERERKLTGPLAGGEKRDIGSVRLKPNKNN